VAAQPENPSLVVEGDIQLMENFNLKGVDRIIGQYNLSLSGDPEDGPDLTISASGNAGFRQTFSNVAFNIRNSPTNSQILNVELNDGTNVFQIQSDQDVFVMGDFFVSNGTKNFILDHPLDPSNLSLVHNAVEGPGHFTYYYGTTLIGPDSTATVRLPDYFESLNSDFHYQLTCIGGYASVYISEEVSGNEFRIAGGYPGLKISWQISAERHDPWARDHPYQVVLKKVGVDRGKYWYPQGYGYSNAMLMRSDQELEIKK